MDNSPKLGPYVKAFRVVLLLLFLVLAIRLWYLQSVKNQAYLRLAQLNAAHTMPVIAPRGIIYDRYGKVLVGNRAVFSAYLVQSEIRDREHLLNRASSLLKVPKEHLLKVLKAKKARPFDPILVKDDLSLETVARIEEQKLQLSGLIVNTKPVRVYPGKSLAAHVLGYIGEVTAQDIERSGSLNIRSGDLIGKTGVEKIYDQYLRGINGGQRMAIESYGKPTSIRGYSDSQPGKNLTLTIDLDLQKACEASLGQKPGAVIVIDPNNGQVLALASYPNYDPNIFSLPVDPKVWSALQKRAQPFLNRGIAAYPAGSVFKSVTLSAALEKGFSSVPEVFNCPGFYKLGARTAKCWKTSGHGRLSLLEGLVQSCNVVFYGLGKEIGPEILRDFASSYGLGHKTGIDLPAEAAGLVPDPQWKKRVLKEPWYLGDSINYGIGQGFLWVTPIQIANLYASIANGKDRFEPHLILSIRDREGQEEFSYKPKVIGSVPVSDKNLSHIRRALREVVSRGTGRFAEIASFEAAGKTGTAENPAGAAHAWFVCYAPYKEPRIAVAAFVEHGGHGNTVTAQIAKEVLNWYHKYRVKGEKEKEDAGKKNNPLS
ncbi:MAG: penicillin-binding protein 2 [Candidatus Margulisiibacteriota bacterium]